MNKTLVKYELINETFNTGIHLILWSDDVVLDENYLYYFKFVCVEMYNNNSQMSFNTFSKHEKGKKVTKINISNNFKHLSQNNDTTVMISQYEMFHFHSKGI